MASKLSLLARIRALLHLPSKLDKTKARFLDAEGKAPSQIGTWECICGHQNALCLLPSPALHPLGLMACRACRLPWHGNICLDITSQTTGIRFPSTRHATDLDSATVLSLLRNSPRFTSTFVMAVVMVVV